MVNEWYCHVVKKILMHIFSSDIRPFLHPSCSLQVARSTCQRSSQLDHRSWQSQCQPFPWDSCIHLFPLHQVKSLNEVQRRTLQFDSVTFQVGQVLIHCEKKAHCPLSYISSPTCCDIVSVVFFVQAKSNNIKCLHYKDIHSVEVR